MASPFGSTDFVTCRTLRPQTVTRAVDTFQVQLGVIDMSDLKRPIAMSWCREVQVPMKRRHLVTGSSAFPLQRLIEDRSLIYGETERLVAWNRRGLRFAHPFQPDP